MPYIEENYHPIPQPADIPEREKEDAMGAYFMMFASVAIGLPLPILNLLASFIYYYLNKSKGLYVKFHTLQALLSQLPVSLLNSVGVFWLIRIFVLDMDFSNYFAGFMALIVVSNLTYLVFSIIGAVKARKGNFYYFWFFGPLSYQMVYKIKANNYQQIENKPPR